MHSALKLRIFAIALALLWAAPAQPRDFKININDLPQLIFDPGDTKHDTTFTLGPKGYRLFGDYLNQREPKANLQDDSSFCRPFTIGPIYSGDNEMRYWLIAPDSTILISVMHEYYTFENIRNLFIVWELNDDSLMYKCIPDTTVMTSMGYISLNEIHRLNDGGYLVIGSGGGGDDGDGWQSVWFAKWDGGCLLNEIYELSSTTELCRYRENLTYVFDTLSYIATLALRHDSVIDCSEEFQPIYADSTIVTTERVDILKLLK